jgi:TPR repeat protein
MPPAAGTAQSATRASEWGVKLSLDETSPSSPGGPQPKVAMMPVAKTLEAAPTFALPVPRNRPFSGADIAWLLARGDWLFATGDVASARFLYERGVDAGAARAAMKLGETFDPVYLHYSHLRGLRGDPGAAAFWYRRARDLGAIEVANRLERLEAIERRN